MYVMHNNKKNNTCMHMHNKNNNQNGLGTGDRW